MAYYSEEAEFVYRLHPCHQRSQTSPSSWHNCYHLKSYTKDYIRTQTSHEKLHVGMAKVLLTPCQRTVTDSITRVLTAPESRWWRLHTFSAAEALPLSIFSSTLAVILPTFSLALAAACLTPCILSGLYLSLELQVTPNRRKVYTTQITYCKYAHEFDEWWRTSNSISVRACECKCVPGTRPREDLWSAEEWKPKRSVTLKNCHVQGHLSVGRLRSWCGIHVSQNATLQHPSGSHYCKLLRTLYGLSAEVSRVLFLPNFTTLIMCPGFARWVRGLPGGVRSGRSDFSDCNRFFVE